MEQRAERTDHELDRLVELELPHVPFAKLDREVGRAPTSDGQHRRRAVPADDPLPGLLRDRDRDPAGADTELDNGPDRSPRQRDVPVDVFRHVCGPEVVVGREMVVLSHGGVVSEQMSALRVFAFTPPRLVAGASAR